MHPTALLISWLFVLVAIQFFGYPLLIALSAVIFFFGRDAVASWGGYIHRARWLLLAMWLVLSYGVPGDAMFDQDSLPTWAGVDAANLQALRLILILGSLAWLFKLLGRAGLVAALWGLLMPFRQRGIDVDRLVVRLSLVLDHLKTPQKKGAWRQMLHEQSFPKGEESVSINLPSWRFLDSLMLSLLIFALLAAVML